MPNPVGRKHRHHIIVAPLVERIKEAREHLRAIPFDRARGLAAESVAIVQRGIAFSRFTSPSAAPTSSPTSEPTAITCVPAFM